MGQAVYTGGEGELACIRVVVGGNVVPEKVSARWKVSTSS